MLAFAVVWIVLATAAVVLATQRKFASIDETSLLRFALPKRIPSLNTRRVRIARASSISWAAL